MTKHVITPDSIAAAKALVSRLCEKGLVRMSVPVDFARDEDMLICALIEVAEKSLTTPTPASSRAATLLPTDAMIHAAAHAFDVSQATFLVKMRCALSAALARQEAAQPADDGYATAFYEIASVLGIGARADSPQNVFRNEMLPRIVALASPQPAPAPFQNRVQPWLMACFGEMIAGNREERNHRFLEEALELVQACDCTASEAHQLVDYVFGRPVGEKVQEVGGVMVTLAALCLAQGLDMHDAAEVELVRIWTKVEKIQAKQAAKPKHSPLPKAAAPAQEGKP